MADLLSTSPSHRSRGSRSVGTRAAASRKFRLLLAASLTAVAAFFAAHFISSPDPTSARSNAPKPKIAESPPPRRLSFEPNRSVAPTPTLVVDQPPSEIAEAFASERGSPLEVVPREKSAALQSIERDYRELTEQICARSSGLIAPEDREKLALLEREKINDLAEVLTPPELEEYQLRIADTDRLRRR